MNVNVLIYFIARSIRDLKVNDSREQGEGEGYRSDGGVGDLSIKFWVIWTLRSPPIWQVNPPIQALVCTHVCIYAKLDFSEI